MEQCKVPEPRERPNRERRHLAGVLTFFIRETRRLEAGAPGNHHE
jgi:hypothetical protein